MVINRQSLRTTSRPPAGCGLEAEWCSAANTAGAGSSGADLSRRASVSPASCPVYPQMDRESAT